MSRPSLRWDLMAAVKLRQSGVDDHRVWCMHVRTHVIEIDHNVALGAKLQLAGNGDGHVLSRRTALVPPERKPAIQDGRHRPKTHCVRSEVDASCQPGI